MYRENPDDLAPVGVPDPSAETTAAIFERARLRGRTKGLAYAGEVTPGEAWRLHEAGAARLVDVRTEAEWEFVGAVPDVPLVEWRGYRESAPNPRFLKELESMVGRERPILLLCRSGVRSHHAADAAARAGFPQVFNVLEGFEGELDSRGRRGTRGGWRAAGLPWEQG
jgi:rhodanese-related sulfurtransferase